MKRIREFILKMCLIRLNLWQAVLFLFVMSLALTLFLFLLQPLPFSYVLRSFVQNRGFNLFLNWLPLFLLMLIFYFAGTGAASASTIVGAFAIMLSFANRNKILLRHDPLVPWDLLLSGELYGVIHSFGFWFIFGVIVISILYILIAVVAAFVVRSEKINWRFRVFGLVAVIALAFVINRPLYANHEINNRLVVFGNVWNQVNQFNSRGFVYSFIFSYNTNRVMRPDGYDRNLILAEIRNADTGGFDRLYGETLPHIIMIQGEAFSDIALSPHFNFDGFNDPLYNWRILSEESISGHIVVSVIGGGTAQTEFDVLTGLNSHQFAGVPFAFRMITREFESMATLLNRLGYTSEFMHPGFDWFYNRQNVYRHLGFSRLMFIDEFEGVPTKGGYINEHDTISRTMEMFRNHRLNSPNTPYFNFTVTIQNHGPYRDMYLIDGPVTGPTFTSDLPFTDVDINSMSNYFHGLEDADRELRRLTDYLNTLAEPVVVVYFGDHKPALHMRVYDLLLPEVYEPGSLEDLTRLFRIPFIIWFNEAAKELYNVSHPIELTNQDEELLFSASFLGAYVMEILGLTNLSPFWDFNTSLRQQFPVVMETRSFTADGRISTNLSREEREPLILYRNWSYFRLFDE